MIAAAVRVGSRRSTMYKGRLTQRHDPDAEQHLAGDDAVVVDLHPQDAHEQGEREEHAHPHDVVKLLAQVHPVGSPL